MRWIIDAFDRNKMQNPKTTRATISALFWLFLTQTDLVYILNCSWNGKLNEKSIWCRGVYNAHSFEFNYRRCLNRSLGYLIFQIENGIWWQQINWKNISIVLMANFICFIRIGFYQPIIPFVSYWLLIL